MKEWFGWIIIGKFTVAIAICIIVIFTVGTVLDWYYTANAEEACDKSFANNIGFKKETMECKTVEIYYDPMEPDAELYRACSNTYLGSSQIWGYNGCREISKGQYLAHRGLQDNTKGGGLNAKD